MFNDIIFPTDGGEAATQIIDLVERIARSHDATVHVINVADTSRHSTVRIQGNILDTLEEDGKQIVQQAAEQLSGRNLSVYTDVLQGIPDEMILEYADHQEADLIVMPTHGRTGVERTLLGSVAERVIRHSNSPVLTLRPDDFDATYPYESVLVPTDGSSCAQAALTTGIELVNTHEADLHLLTVLDTEVFGLVKRSEEQVTELESEANDILTDSADQAATAGISDVTTAVQKGSSVHREIISYVNRAEIDLIVLGTHGRDGIDRYVFGSVAEKLARMSPVPVMTVRHN